MATKNNKYKKYMKGSTAPHTLDTHIMYILYTYIYFLFADIRKCIVYLYFKIINIKCFMLTL